MMRIKVEEVWPTSPLSLICTLSNVQSSTDHSANKLAQVICSAPLPYPRAFQLSKLTAVSNETKLTQTKIYVRDKSNGPLA